MTANPAGSILIFSSPGENFPLFAVLLVAGMYWLGGRRFRAACRMGTISHERMRAERRRSACFVLGLVAIVFALQEPMDHWADRLFWVHMVQHMLLIVVAAPLIVIGAPWMRVFKALPLSWRRTLALWALRGRSGAPLRALARALAKPKVAWGVLAFDVLIWHLPAAYDLTLRSNAVHYTEHATFLIAGLIAWGHLIESPPLHPILTEPYRVMFAFTQMVVMWILALALAFATEPWYSPYAKLQHRPGGISAITDQHLAGGIMWIPASIPWGVAIIVWVYRWVAEAWQQNPPRPEPAVLPPSPPPQPRPEPALEPELASARVPVTAQLGSETPAPRRRAAEPVARAGAYEPAARSRGYPLSKRSNAAAGTRPRSAPETRRSNA